MGPLLLVSLWLLPAKVPTSSQEAFTTACAPLLKDALTARGVAATVEVSDRLSLRVRGAGRDLAVSLERPWSVCAKAPASCQPTVEKYLGDVAAQLAIMFKGEPSAEASQLRIVARGGAYVERVKAQAPDLVSRPLGGDLVLLAMLDFPTAARPLMRKDLTALKLDEKAVWTTALANLKKQLGSIEKLTPGGIPQQGLGYLTPAGYYNSGLTASSDDWAPLAKKAKGKLLLSVPTDEIVLYGDSAEPGFVEAFAAITDKMFAEAERPVSKQILEWTPKGWKVFAR